MTTTKRPRTNHHFVRGLPFYVIHGQANTLRLGYRLLLSVQPFANVVGCYTCRCGNEEGNNDIHDGTPFPYRYRGGNKCIITHYSNNWKHFLPPTDTLKSACRGLVFLLQKCSGDGRTAQIPADRYDLLIPAAQTVLNKFRKVFRIQLLLRDHVKQFVNSTKILRNILYDHMPFTVYDRNAISRDSAVILWSDWWWRQQISIISFITSYSDHIINPFTKSNKQWNNHSHII